MDILQLFISYISRNNLFIFFVLQKDPSGEKFIALAVAGGGGGMSFKVGSNAIKANGGLTQGGSGYSAITPPDGPGKIKTPTRTLIRIPLLSF